MQASLQDRLIGALGAAIVVLLFGWMLILGLTVGIDVRPEQVLTLLDLRPPRPAPPRPRPRVYRPKTGKTSGKASPRNLRNKATEIVARPAPIPPPMPPVIAAPTPGEGLAASAGASDRPGPGQGAGGEGDGYGSGGYGEGEGDGGGDLPPRQIGRGLDYSDLPSELKSVAVAGTVSVRFFVNVDGRASGCVILGSSGDAELDQVTCRLIEQRFRFRPSRNADGQKVRSIVEADEQWIVPRQDDARPPR